jgi:hypothetical protein
MEIFKEKEESEIISKTLDPEKGLEIDLPNVNLEEISLSKKSLKLKSFKESHKSLIEKKQKSDLQEIENNFKVMEEQSHLEEISELPSDFEEVLVSIDEFIEYLDNSEEQIDV